MPQVEKAFDGIFATSMAVESFKKENGRWPVTKEDLDQGAAATGVKFPRGVVQLNPHKDGSLTITFRDGKFFETWTTATLRNPIGQPSTPPSR